MGTSPCPRYCWRVGLKIKDLGFSWSQTMINFSYTKLPFANANLVIGHLITLFAHINEGCAFKKSEPTLKTLSPSDETTCFYQQLNWLELFISARVSPHVFSLKPNVYWVKSLVFFFKTYVMQKTYIVIANYVPRILSFYREYKVWIKRNILCNLICLGRLSSLTVIIKTEGPFKQIL